MSAVAAFAGGACAVVGLVELAGDALRLLAARLPRLAVAVGETFARAAREGRHPAGIERRRLLLVAAGLGGAAGLFVAGPLIALALGAAAPWLVARAVRARRESYRQAVDAGAATIATALADALGGGHSLRGALGEVARGGVPGPAGRELRRLAGELALGAHTDGALEALRARIRTHRVETLVAACLLQRRAGGELATLLRDCARAFEDQARLEQEARAATAQARFTGLVVVLLPLGGALLAELASPGYLSGLAGSALTLWLGGVALVLQTLAAVLIRRLARVRT